MEYSIEPVTLNFKTPAGTSRGIYHTRKVWYIHLQDGTYHGIGECAPLHDLSCDYRPDMESIIDNACRKLTVTGKIDYPSLSCMPSVVFALETALLSLEGSRHGDGLRLYDNSFTRLGSGIPINGLVWMGSYEEMSERIEEKLRQGFKCIKIKIAAIDYDKEIELLSNLRKRFPVEQLQIRVDANGGFKPQEAPEVLKTLHSLRIHSIEQPIAAKQWETMAALCKNSPIPIALDEELIGINTIERKQALLDIIKPQFIVLKPTLHGGLRGCEEWISQAKQRNIGYWVTSALESNVGLNAIAQWTAKIGSTYMPQRLGTGQLFTTNYEPADLEIKGEFLWYKSERQRNFKKEVQEFSNEWNCPSETIPLQTSGSTGKPKIIQVKKTEMIASAKATIEFLGLKPGDSALLCLPLKYIAGKMMAVRSIVGNMRLIPVYPSARPFRTLTVPPIFAAITPQQATESLRYEHDTNIMSHTKVIIIGGGPVPTKTEMQLYSFPNKIYSTYGMTETLSHIAMRRINGQEASPCYTPMKGVSVSLTESNRLVIHAPKINKNILTTNDIATIHPNNTFTIEGRIDNTICSGGIKLQLESIEQRLQTALDFPFVLTSVEDQTLGESLAMLYEGSHAPEDIRIRCKACLNKYEVPRHILHTDKIPLTPTGKPARILAKQLAKSIVKLP
ncbi:MAG: enolase C-terminal domain-like protein [Bacteroidaceae bacterium]|nr:enolase C-terminal domain-like protein [Prevotellaceae bacterium]MDY2848746.1 enolase C-terminal domain-like protein [Bacteroidaceae bacterium]